MKKQRIRYFTPKNIHKQKKGKGYGIRFSDPRDNKRKFYPLGVTIEEARARLSEFNQLYTSLKKPNVFSYQVTVKQAIDLWLEQKKAELSNPNTLIRYSEIMDNFMHFLKNKDTSLIYIADLGQEHFEEYKEYRRNIKQRKPRTVNFELDMLSNLFNCLKVKKYVSYNPVSEVKRVQEPELNERWFDKNEVKLIFDYLKSRRSRVNWYAIFSTYYYTGMRRNELRYLEWKDIDFTKDIILIVHKEGFKPKTDKPRPIPIHPELMPILKSLPKTSRYVFPNTKGKIFKKDTFTQKLKQVLKKLGLKDGKLHSFRHTWTAHCFMAGIPGDVIKAIGGWKEARMVDRYKHLHPDYIAEEFKKRPLLKDD